MLAFKISVKHKSITYKKQTKIYNNSRTFRDICLYLNVTDGIERYVVNYLNRMYSNLSVTIFERIRIFPELPVFIRI